MQIIEYTSNKNFFELKMRNIGMMYKVSLGFTEDKTWLCGCDAIGDRYEHLSIAWPGMHGFTHTSPN